MNTNSSVETLQYGCECGKQFSGQPNRVNMILRLHYKKCKFEHNKEVNYVVSMMSSDKPRSSQKHVSSLVDDEKSQKQRNKILNSS